jgi:cation-transporting ATPase I
VQIPGFSDVFGCRPNGPVGWTIALGAASAATAASLVAPRDLPLALPDTEQMRAWMPRLAASPAQVAPDLRAAALRPFEAVAAG